MCVKRKAKHSKPTLKEAPTQILCTGMIQLIVSALICIVDDISLPFLLGVRVLAFRRTELDNKNYEVEQRQSHMK